MADRQFKCQNCTKSFSSSHQLAQHVRIHTSEKPYKCSVCEKSFKQLSHVQQHTRLHTGERPYKCSDLNCGRAFTQLSNLQQHMKTHQNGVDKSERTEKRYVNSSSCPICGKTYVNEGSLKKHIQTTHADVINNSFNDIQRQPNSSPLNSIVQINYNLIVNNGTFSCSACNETFETKPDLLQHLEQMKSDSRHQYSSAEILLNAASIRPQNAIQMTNNSANNLLIINNQNNAFLELTSRVLNNRSNTSKKR